MRTARWTTLRPLLAGAMLLAASCSDDGGTGPGRWSAEGLWMGRTYGETLSVGLKEDGTRLSGGGSLESQSRHLSFAIYGAHEGATVSFILRNPDYLEATFNGTMTAPDTIRGHLNGSGFSYDPVTLVRR